MDTGNISNEMALPRLSPRGAENQGAGKSDEISDSEALQFSQDTLSLNSSEEGPTHKPAVHSAFFPAKASGYEDIDSPSISSLENGTSAAFVPGLTGAALSTQLETLSRNQVGFFVKRGFRIPLFQKKYVKIGPDEAERIITRGSEKEQSSLEAVLEDNTHIPLFSKEDAHDLAAFNKLDNSTPVSKPELMSFLREVERQGLKMRVRDTSITGGYNAYRHLAGRKVIPGNQGKPVEILYQGTPVMLLTQDKTGDIKALKLQFDDTVARFKMLGKNPELVKEVVRQPLNVPVPDRIEIAAGILRHSGDYMKEPQWDKTVESYEYLRKLAGDDGDFVTLGKMYLEMLDAYDSVKWIDGYHEGLSLISSKLRHNPDDYRVFIDLLKSGAPPLGAVRMYEMLPQPPGKGEYEKVAQVFKSDRLNGPAPVELIMPAVGSSSLKERLEIMSGIYRHTGDYMKEPQWDKTVESYKYLRKLAGDDGDFLALGKMYLEMLDTFGSEKWDEGYHKGLSFYRELHNGEPWKIESFKRLLGSAQFVKDAVSAFEIIQNPFCDEDYSSREKAALSLFGGGFDISEKYAVLCRNAQPEGTFKGTAALLGAIIRGYDGGNIADCEALLKRLQQEKASLSCAELSELVGAFQLRDSETMFQAMNLLKEPVKAEGFRERKDFYLSLARSEKGFDRRLLQSSLVSYRSVIAGIQETETFEMGVGRFRRLLNALREKNPAEPDEALKIYTKICEEMKAGTFGEKTPDKITDEFLEILLVSESPEQALSHLIGSNRRPDGTAILESENEISIDGIRLEKSD